MKKKGLEREPSQTANEFSQLASNLLPDQANNINSFTQQYSDMCYSSMGDYEEKASLLKLKKLLQKIKGSRFSID